MGKESDHAFSAGYEGPRAIRTWRERMKTLEKNHFIVTKKVGNEEFAYVALVHPTVAVQKLIDDKRVSEDWLAAYRHRKLETKEPAYDKLLEKRNAGLKVVYRVCENDCHSKEQEEEGLAGAQELFRRIKMLGSLKKREGIS